MYHQHANALSGKLLLDAIASNADLPTLSQANLDGCGLTAFPDEILKLPGLTALSLYDNLLADVRAISIACCTCVHSTSPRTSSRRSRIASVLSSISKCSIWVTITCLFYRTLSDA